MPQWGRLFSLAGRDVLPPRFSAEDETLFRETLRRNLLYARTGLFLVLAIGFGLAPLYQEFLFQPRSAVVPMLIWIECVLAVPVLLAAAVLSARPTSRPLTRATQSAAVLVSLLAVIALRYFALLGEMVYPAEMVGVVMIALAVFGGFRWRRMAAGSALAGTIAVALEFTHGTPETAPALHAYTLVYMTLIAVAACYTQETLMRFTWWESMQLRRVRAELRLQTLTDELTGHYNRRGFNTMADQARALARSLRQPCVLLFVDVDDLKGINDRYGHSAGDQAIVAVGEALRVCSRNNDIVARVGGDEFLLFAADCRSVEGLKRRIGNHLQDASAGWALAFTVTATIGVMDVDPTGETPIEAIVAGADALMLQAKRERAAAAAAATGT